MKHILDNPAWHALNSGNSYLAHGSGLVKYFAQNVSPFLGLEHNSPDEFAQLHSQLPDGRVVCLMSTQERDIPAQWKVLHCVSGLQMCYLHHKIEDNINITPVALADEHIPQMMELTQLTKPGPFDERTIDFGHYYGIFDGSKLVAMAGQRLHAFNYAEISAVCTHPDYLGRGYARQLLKFHINRIIAAGEVPILHVRHDNERAIKVYHDMGFTTRGSMYFYIITKA